MVADRTDPNVGFLKDFTPYSVLEALAGLDETGNRRITPFGPAILPAQQAAFAVSDQDDYRRINARKYFAGTIRIQAYA